MNPPAIAIVLNAAWNIWNFRQPMIQSLQNSGYRVICFAPEDEYTAKLKEKGIEIHPLTQLDRKGTNPVRDLRLIKELEQAYRHHQIDLAIHFTIKPNIYGSFAARRAGIPSLAVVTGLGYTFLSSGLSARAAKLLYKRAFRRNSCTVFQNPDDRELFIRTRLASENKTMVIPGSGIDTELFREAPLPDGKTTFLFIGRLLADKGIHELIEGFHRYAARNESGDLVIVGDIDSHNPASLKKEDLADLKQNKRIHFMGFQEDVRSYLRDASVVVLPSYREGLPRTLLEALSTGRPVITTDVPGCREVAKEGVNGYLVPVRDTGALAEAMEKFHRLDSVTKVRMSHSSRQMAEELFSTEVVNAAYIDLVRQTLDNN